MHDELTRYRLQRATDMLVNTDATLKEIAFAIGIPRPSNFSRFIKQETGMTPGQFRKHGKRL